MNAQNDQLQAPPILAQMVDSCNRRSMPRRTGKYLSKITRVSNQRKRMRYLSKHTAALPSLSVLCVM